MQPCAPCRQRIQQGLVPYYAPTSNCNLCALENDQNVQRAASELTDAAEVVALHMATGSPTRTNQTKLFFFRTLLLRARVAPYYGDGARFVSLDTVMQVSGSSEEQWVIDTDQEALLWDFHSDEAFDRREVWETCRDCIVQSLLPPAE